MQTPEQAEKRHSEEEIDKEKRSRQKKHEPTRLDIID